MPTRTLPPTDRYTNCPETSDAFKERAMYDLLKGAEEHEHEITHGFDEAQLDDGDPCTVVRQP
ncbi:MAG: hypothetical protein IPI35_24655 [Deltaproteobacteria bacterium]|nr:hypothetical protein [Deltaproteobacteria bacterium]